MEPQGVVAGCPEYSAVIFTHEAVISQDGTCVHVTSHLIRCSFPLIAAELFPLGIRPSVRLDTGFQEKMY